MRVTDKYVFFWGSEFSNFYPCRFTVDGIEFNCSEQYFMWRKAKFFNDEECAEKILKAKHPQEQKRLGRNVKDFDIAKWEIEREDAMYQGVYNKFSQNQKLKNLLLKYKDHKFVEASPYDRIWGIGMREDAFGVTNEKHWLGLNLLGKIIDKVRDELAK